MRTKAGKCLTAVSIVAAALVVVAGSRPAIAADPASALPRTLAELDLWYPAVPPEDNGALVYLEAFNAFVFGKPGVEERIPFLTSEPLAVPVEVLTPETKELMAEYLVANGTALVLLHKASAYPRCRYPIDLKLGEMVLLPHLARARQGQRLLCLQALQAADRHNSEAVVWPLKASIALAQSFRAEPMMMSQIIRISLCAISVTCLEQILNRHALEGVYLTELQEAFAGVTDQEPLARAFVGERCIEQHKPIGEHQPPDLLPDEQEIQTLDLLIQACRKSWPEFANAVFAMTGDLSATGPSSTQHGPPRSAAPRAAHAAIRNAAQLQTAVAALAVERFRAANRKLPDSLSVLVPDYLKEIPQDPFDGAPIRYRVTETGYRVYSIYHNRQDDHGEKGNARPELDFVFAVEGQPPCATSVLSTKVPGETGRVP